MRRNQVCLGILTDVKITKAKLNDENLLRRDAKKI